MAIKRWDPYRAHRAKLLSLFFKVEPSIRRMRQIARRFRSQPWFLPSSAKGTPCSAAIPGPIPWKQLSQSVLPTRRAGQKVKKIAFPGPCSAPFHKWLQVCLHAGPTRTFRSFLKLAASVYHLSGVAERERGGLGPFCVLCVHSRSAESETFVGCNWHSRLCSGSQFKPHRSGANQTNSTHQE